MGAWGTPALIRGDLLVVVEPGSDARDPNRTTDWPIFSVGHWYDVERTFRFYCTNVSSDVNKFTAVGDRDLRH
jgi:hypothetical protein